MKFHMTKAQIIRACIIIPLVIALGVFLFTNYFQYPQVEIWRDANRLNSVVIPIKDNYVFDNSNLYSIEETLNGYDIIIHVINN